MRKKVSEKSLTFYFGNKNLHIDDVLQTQSSLSGNAKKYIQTYYFIRLVLKLSLVFDKIIDNLRNGLETQAKVYATSVIRFTLEPCVFTLNTFQGIVSTCFKQEQKCECNCRLLNFFREINKVENHHLMFS